MSNKQKAKPNIGLVDYYDGHGAFTRVHRPDSVRAVAEFNECECCGEKGTLKCISFKSLRGGSPVDISKCSACGDENEF
jgi:hypothetical protein